MRQEKTRKNNRIMGIALVVLLLTIFGSATLFLRSQEAESLTVSIDSIHSERSTGIVTGEGYTPTSSKIKELENTTKKTAKKQVTQSKAWRKAAPTKDTKKSQQTDNKQNTNSNDDPTNGGGGDGGEEAVGIQIKTNLQDGKKYAGNKLSFYVQATDSDGRKIPKSNFSVLLNGDRMYSSGDNYKALYNRTIGASGNPVLREGSNEITITVTADDGESVTLNITIQMASDAEATPIGTMSVSVDASALGLGTVVAEKSVTIYEGDRLSDVVTRYFGEKGVRVSAKSSDYEYYLSRIYVSADGVDSELREQFDPPLDSIGEKDYGTSSGWKFELNRKRNLNALSSIEAYDGDEITIYYTMGMDD